jgi:hypothetical protein
MQGRGVSGESRVESREQRAASNEQIVEDRTKSRGQGP